MSRKLYQRNLPELSTHFLNFGSSIARVPLDPTDIRMTAISRRAEDSKIVWTEPGEGERPLYPFELLKQLTQINDYRGQTPQASRQNVGSVAVISGFAVGRMHEMAQEKEVRFSTMTINGLRKSVLLIHDRIETAFRPTFDPGYDYEALRHLSAARDILKQR